MVIGFMLNVSQLFLSAYRVPIEKGPAIQPGLIPFPGLNDVIRTQVRHRDSRRRLVNESSGILSKPKARLDAGGYPGSPDDAASDPKAFRNSFQFLPSRCFS
jgi:hypothetical protein